MEYDVAIVGSGPAGASAAYWLTEAGRRVLVLEKEHLPRYKACGGGVPKSVFDRFPFDFSPVVEREISRVRFRFRDGREVRVDLPDRPGAMVMRDRFDLHILRHSGAEVREGALVNALVQDEAGVEVTTRQGETLRARYLLGADGANSRVARLVGLRRGRPLGATIEAEVPADNDLMEEYADTALFLFGTLSEGYLWIFPKAEHLSLGIGTFSQRGQKLREILKREMAELGIDIEGVPQHGHPLPIYLRHEPLHRGRVLLAGDAAGLVDPLMGEGIRHAVDSGRLAAEALLAGDLAAYTRRVHREIGADLLWGRCWARRLHEHPRASFELGARNPLVLQMLLHLLDGRTTYRRMAWDLLPNVLRGIGRRLPVEQCVRRS